MISKLQSPAPLIFFVIAMGLLSAFSLSAQADTIWRLEAQTWSRPRSAALVAQLPAVQAVVSAWAQNPQRQIIIRHAGDEAGELWATELEEWLIALGVAGDRIETRPGGEPYTLELFLQ